MTKIQIKKLSNKFGWTLDETKKAIDELSRTHSLTDLSEVLNICYRAKNPKERYELFSGYLNKTIDGKLSNVVSNLLLIDPSFKVLALFNYYDLIWTTNHEKPVALEFSKKIMSFVQWRSFVNLPKEIYHLNPPRNKDFRDYIENPEMPLRYNPAIFAENLSYSYVETLIHMRLEKNDKGILSPKILGEFFVDVIKEVNFLVFNIKLFAHFVSTRSHLPNLGLGDEILKNFALSLGQSFISSSEITKRKYWLMYVLAKELQSRKHGVRESFRIVAGLLETNYATVATRFYERQKDAIRLGMSLEDIIFKYHLSLELNNLLNISR